MDLNKLLEAIVGLHGAVEKLRADLARSGVSALPSRYHGQSSKRIGKIERHVLEVARELAAEFPRIPRDNFINLCAARLPLRPDAQRDTRRQLVMRAIGTLRLVNAPPLVVDGTDLVLGHVTAPAATDLI